MRIGVAMPIYPPQYGGGVKNAREILIRLTRDFEITLFPTSDTLLTIREDDDKERILRALETYESIGIEVCDKFHDVLREFKPMSTFGKILNVITLNLTRQLTSRYLKCGNKLNFIVDLLFVLPDVVLLSKLSDGKYGFIHQSNVTARTLISRLWKATRYTGINKDLPYQLMTQVPPTFNNHINLERLLRTNPKPRFVALISKGQAELLGFCNHLPCVVLDPSNAVDPELLRHRTGRKEDYLVFYARLHPEKGLYEIPRIISIIRNEYDKHVKLKIMGAFQSKTTEKIFWKLVSKYGVNNNIEYLGFVNEEVKHEVAARARALIYPSHSDYFSLVLLETITLGTIAVAYKIPGPYSTFSELPAIKFVPEFSIKNMANMLIEVLKMDDNEYQEIINNDAVMKFITKHLSWDNVANQIKNLIIRNLKTTPQEA
ncbi:glycosyltransferase [Vulcanisaeta thermophila]|uniref:glycosyltransferase n=1 Tax=Vulcanisaeta thermophila TaxID=867917 RepID=UPI00085341D8|nr:glycosyltransferase [Vulcanisaeta thermophila]